MKMVIDIKDMLVDKSFYNKRKTKKEKIILTDTLRVDFKNHVNGFKLKGYTPHFTIDKDGTIYKHFDIDYYSKWFENDKTLNKKSIIISIVNGGRLKYVQNKHYFNNWANDYVEDQNVFEQPWRESVYWEKYTDVQIESCANLCNYILKNTNIPRDGYFHHVYNEGARDFNGILTESNLNKIVTTLNPHFDFKKLKKMVMIKKTKK